jgi:acyl carrier protein
MTYEDWETAVSPKVQGTWNLHEALLGEQLDFFVLFSSISGIVGQWGQSNYAAANTFLDSFVQYRHRLGLPASVMDVGVMEDVGFVSQNSAILQQFKATGSYTLREQDLLDSLQLAIAKSGPQFSPTPSSLSSTGKYRVEFANPGQLIIGLRSTMPLSDPTNRIIWKRDSRMSIYHNLETVQVSVGEAANESLKLFLKDCATNSSILRERPSADFLAREIGLKLFNLMLKPEEDLDISAPLSAVGLDSLMAIEIRSWWRQTFGFNISVLEILNCGSVADLGKAAANGLLAKYSMASPGANDTYLLMKAP